MRIAIIGPYFWPQLYGIEKVMYAHAKHLSAMGHEVLVVSSRLRFPHGRDNNLPAYETRDGFQISRLNVALRTAPLVHYPSRGGLLLAGLQKALLRFRPEVVHAHNSGAAAWAFGGALYARRQGAAFFYSPHFHPNKLRFDGIRKAAVRAINYLPLRSAAKIYHLTSHDFEIFSNEYRYAPTDRFAVLLNGVDPPDARIGKRPLPDKLNVLFVGRVDDTRKGFAVLEAAIHSLPEDIHRAFQLVVVGSISDATRDRLVRRYGKTITVLGAVSEADLEIAYAAADIFVMPSLYEGFGMPYIEAMRYGTPVIGTDVGGIAEVVPPGTGLLAAPGDWQAVANSLTRLVVDPHLRRTIGEAGEAWSKRFYWQRIVTGLLKDYADSVATP